jgi:hypothetical protein
LQFEAECRLDQLPRSSARGFILSGGRSESGPSSTWCVWQVASCIRTIRDLRC